MTDTQNRYLVGNYAPVDREVTAVDLQDLGCRIYTFVTTLLYVLQAAAKHGKSWCLRRPHCAKSSR